MAKKWAIVNKKRGKFSEKTPITVRKLNGGITTEPSIVTERYNTFYEKLYNNAADGPLLKDPLLETKHE